MNDPQINQKNTTIDNEDVIIERHEDGSECRKCKNCACVNNKLANAGLDLKGNDSIESKAPVLESTINL